MIVVPVLYDRFGSREMPPLPLNPF
jgi:hypothetical protein